MSQLSRVQQQAVTHRDGPMLVLAGPGSGKTLVLTWRVRYLTEVCHINPGEILVITFTRAAAREMKERYLGMTGSESTKVSFGTFHAVFFQILKLAYGYRSENILREEEKYRFYASDTVEKFLAFANSVLPCEIREAQQIPIEEY